MRVTRSLLAVALCLAASLPASADDISVLVNQARIVKLARAADTVIVGNPAIADASVKDASTLVLTGRGFGVTNLVVLDKDGAAVIDTQIVVSRRDANSLRVYRGAAVQTLSCTPVCETAYVSGAEGGSSQAVQSQ